MRITIGQKEMAVLNELNRFEKKANNLNKKPYSEEDKRRIRKICLDNIKRLAGDNGWLFEYRQELSVFIERLQDAVNEDEMFFPLAATPQQAEKFVPDSRLTTDKARAMFDAFEKAGFITKLEDGHLKWAKNKFSLKCFVDNAIKYLHLDKTKSPSGKVKKSWAIFEKLFVSDKFTTNRLQNYRINYVLSYDDNPESKEVQLIFNKNKTF